MRNLGMRIQLNHPNGESCYNPVNSYNDDFTVIDLNGIHSVAVNYCNCHLMQPHTVQLLWSWLYLAMVIDLKTVATFQVLEHVHLCTLVSKISAFDFYTTLSHRTDNTGTQEVPVSSSILQFTYERLILTQNHYWSFLLMAQQWRHLTRERGRRLTVASDPLSSSLLACSSLVEDTLGKGQHTPHPMCHSSLMDDVHGLLTSIAWLPDIQCRLLHTLFLGIDTNFHLKCLNVSKNVDDPDLNQGSAYFIDDKAFRGYLQEYDSWIPNDHSTCSNYDVIKLASMWGGKGTATTGVGTIECIRHDMKGLHPLEISKKENGMFSLDSSFKSHILDY